MKKSSRDLQKEQTRALLIETASDVFSSKGIMATRASDIAAAAHVSHGTVFVHFPSMESLIEETVAFYGQKIALHTHALADSQGTLPELLKAHLAGIMAYEPFYTRLVLESRLLPSGARDSFLAIQSAISFHFSRVITAKPPSAGRGEIPQSMLFNMWVGLVHYYLANADLFAPEGSVLKRWGETLIQSYMTLLEAKGEMNHE